MKPWHSLLAAFLLLLFAAQAALGSPANSAAFDEEYHLAAGYAYLRTGDPRLSTEHPPLLNLWNALPLVFLDPQLPLDTVDWQTAHTDNFSDAFFWQANPNLAVRMILLGRLPIMALGVLLGAVVFRWTRGLFGARAALLALVLFAFDPNLIAHARLSSTDLGLTFAMTVAMWRLWAWLEQPTRWNLVWIGLATGAAITIKFTGLMLAPMFLLVAIVYPIRSPRWGVLRRLAMLVASSLVALLVMWAVYGFEVQNGLPAATFWRGLWKIWSEYSLGLPSYLMGEINRTGWWYYFPVTFALKTPLPVFILCVLGIAALTRRPSVERRQSLIVIIPPVISMLAVLFSPLTFGYRHILPILPFVIILAGNAINLGLSLPSRFTFHVLRFAGYALLAWLAISTALIFPHHLSYFNELAGGPENADRFLVDSNLDWGQDLPALKAQMERLELDRVNLSYYGTALPAAYGIRYWPMPAFLHFVIGPEIDSYNPHTPEPGWYAISVTSLRMGLLWREPDLYAYFRDKTPVARAGYSIRLYKVEYPENIPVDRAIVVGDSVFSIDPQTLGVQPKRRLIAKWADNPDVFIFAMSGPARYLTPDPFPFDRDTRRAFRAAARQDGPALILDARAFVEARLAEWRAALPGKTPINFDGKLALIGCRLASPEVARGDSLDLITYWQVTGALDPSLAFFAHVLDEQQNIIGQYDGWGTAIRGLETGDVIVQRVRAPIKPDAAPGMYRLQLGVYSTDTLARWPVRGDAGASADHVALATINVR